MNKTTGIIIGILVLVFGGLVVWSISNSKTTAINYEKYDASKIISANDDNGNIEEHVRGKKDAEVVFVEYYDF